MRHTLLAAETEAVSHVEYMPAVGRRLPGRLLGARPHLRGAPVRPRGTPGGDAARALPPGAVAADTPGGEAAPAPAGAGGGAAAGAPIAALPAARLRARGSPCAHERRRARCAPRAAARRRARAHDPRRGRRRHHARVQARRAPARAPFQHVRAAAACGSSSSGLGSRRSIPGGQYHKYLLPGIIGMSILFSALLSRPRERP